MNVSNIMKTLKITYWVSTVFLTLIMLFSAGMYLFNNAFVAEVFTMLGYPTYIIYPFAIAKLAGLLVIHLDKRGTLKNLAYAGFFYTTVLATTAHVMVNDGGFIPALLAMMAVVASYVSGKGLGKV